MKSNNAKSHLLIVNNFGNVITVGDKVITGENSVKLLGVTIENKLNFDEHVNKICKKANQKLHSQE